MKLHFIVIGFPRCGCASLRQWLQGFPVWLPDWPYAAGVQADAGLPLPDRGRGVEGTAVKGTVVPSFTSAAVQDIDDTAARIKYRWPSVKLVAIKRNPIERAFSEWLQLRSMGETRTFTEAIQDCLGELDEEPTAFNQYVAGGQYDHILDKFASWDLEIFDTSINQMKKPKSRAILADFLGLDPDVAIDLQFPWKNRGPIDRPPMPDEAMNILHEMYGEEGVSV